MGKSLSKSLSNSPPHNLKEKEDAYTVNAMACVYEDVERMASCSPRQMDHSSYRYNFEPMVLPKDNDGYIITFSPEDGEGIRRFFDDYGMVVVRDCLNEEELSRSVEEAWQFLERHSDNAIDRNNPTTWTDRNWPRLQKLGILGDTFVLSPQMEANRYVRNLDLAYGAVLRTSKLRTATQRLSMMRPTRPPNGQKEWATSSSFLHVDMCPCCGGSTTFGFKTRDVDSNTYSGGTLGPGDFPLRVQGFTALWDCPEEAGGFHVVPGFHKHIRGWARQLIEEGKCRGCVFRGTSTSFDVPPDDPMRTQNLAQRVPVRAGSTVIWSSALPHGTFPCSSGQRGRLIQYIAKAREDDPAYGTLPFEK